MPKRIKTPGPGYYREERWERLTKVRPSSCNFNKSKRQISSKKPAPLSEIGPEKYETSVNFGKNTKGGSISPSRANKPCKIDSRDYDIERGYRVTRVRTPGYTFGE